MKFKKTISFLFYGKISRNIKKIINKYNIDTIFRVNSKLNNFIKLFKDPLNINDKNNIV